MEIFLEPERLVLRQFTEDDVDVLVQLDGDSRRVEMAQPDASPSEERGGEAAPATPQAPRGPTAGE